MATSENLPVVVPNYARDEARVKKGFWPKFKALAGRLPFAEDLLAAFYCAKDPASPRQVKIVLMSALAYFVVPSDLIPDIFLGMGFTDDAAVLYLALKTVAGYVTNAHRERARQYLANGEESLRP